MKTINLEAPAYLDPLVQVQINAYAEKNRQEQKRKSTLRYRLKMKWLKLLG
ncbi:hypothetical protein [Actinobacillus delphinicola]|uniref:Uncharacterized protein n=1 Tax=Actinobacillus delphinicola TaxID=51161 RepID=A0A448TUW5_9PAST|nr:hypothetical protein [Actinobacillus delphinicola]VEJ09722.1 Uncharacterised protein [Actinobacillus delphinicola]